MEKQNIIDKLKKRKEQLEKSIEEIEVILTLFDEQTTL